MPRGPSSCTVAGCDRPHHARGWCRKHYDRWYSNRSADAALPRPSREELFWAKVDRHGPSECWPWIAYKTPKGYGEFRSSRTKMMKAHRYAYELLVGPIPDGLDIDHLCRNPACVNPAHMEPVTNRVNTLRGENNVGAKNARKTHCIRGHPFDGDNLGKRLQWRRCRICHRQMNRQYYRNRKKRLADQAAS